MSLSVVGGLGAILDTFIKLYSQEGISPDKVVWLATFPSLFVGIGMYADNVLLFDRIFLQMIYF